MFKKILGTLGILAIAPAITAAMRYSVRWQNSLMGKDVDLPMTEFQAGSFVWAVGTIYIFVVAGAGIFALCWEPKKEGEDS